jgi:hypothetical protein
MKIKLCQCGAEIPRKITPNGSPIWNKYCSDECIKTYSKKNKEIPHYCPCGNSITRKLTPKGKSNWSKYCSDTCRKSYRTIYDNTCQYCGKNYTALRSDVKFCSQSCGWKATQTIIRNCSVCNIEFSTHTKRKYCSEECRKISIDPRTGTGKFKSAICVGCGEEFTKPAYYPSAMKYCSNKCSHKEVKSVRDKFVMELGDKAIVFHSFWEVRFAAACDKHNIPWRRYDGPDIETPLGNHRPDFIIGPEDNENIVEIKGQFDYEDLIKTEKVKEIYGRKYSLLFEEELKYFEETGILFIASPDVPLDIVEHFKTQLKSTQDRPS